MAKILESAKMTEKDWAAKMDAETLMQAKMIEMDKGRMSAAQKMAKMLAEEAKMRAEAASTIVGKGNGENKKENGNKKQKKMGNKK
jgi:hypothetical protein